MKYILPILLIAGLVSGVALFFKLHNISEPKKPATPKPRIVPFVTPTPTPAATPSAFPIPTPPVVATPTPPPPRKTRIVSLSHATAASVLASFAQSNASAAQSVQMLPSSSNAAVILLSTSDQELDACAEAVRFYDDQARLITIYALVGRYNANKGHAVGLFDYVANVSSSDRPELAAILTNLAFDLSTGIATMGGSVSARLVLDMMSQFAANDGRFRVESRPTMTTLSGVPAKFSTGREIPVSTTVNTQMQSQTSVEYRTADFQIELTPTLRPDGSVRLSLNQSNSEVVGTVVLDGNQVPTMSTQKAETIIDLRPGQIFYLGGIKTTIDEKADKGVPGARNIFPLNLLMGRNTSRNETGELVILIAVEVRGGKQHDPFEENFAADPDGFISAPVEVRKAIPISRSGKRVTAVRQNGVSQIKPAQKSK